MKKHYFAAANTGEGFVNYFQDIICPAQNGYAYILKGGPGSGKSTLMRTIGEHFANFGYDVEYFYCSSDPDSLDGVRLPIQNICVLDGTAPHVTEAELPSIRDRIINLGVAISEDIAIYSKQIIELITLKKQMYLRAYDNIKTASKVWQSDNNLPCFSSVSGFRRLFLTAIDNGIIDLADRNTYTNIVSISPSELNIQLATRRRDTIIFPNVLLPNMIEGIQDNNTNTLYRLTTPPLGNAKHFLELSSQYLIKARNAHKSIESYYRQFTDYSQIEKITQELIKQITKRIT